MRRILVLLVSLFIAHCSLLAIARPALAAGNCLETPDYKTPLASQLFTSETMEDKDCGIYPEDSKLQEDNIDYGTVRCLDRPELIASLMGDPNFLQETGGGRATINIKDNANLALGSDTLVANEQALRPLLMAIQMASQGDRQIAASCYAQGYTDLNQCASALNLSLCSEAGNCRLNTLQYPQSSRWDPLKDQLLTIRKRAMVVDDCTDGSVPTDIPCDNIICYNEPCDKNSRDLALYILTNISEANPVADYNNLPNDADRLKVKALMESKAQEKYWIVIERILDSGQYNSVTIFLAKLLNQDKEIYIIPRYLPSLPHIYDTTLDRYRKLQPLGRGDEIVNQIKQSLYLPVDHNQNLNQQVLEKIKKSGVNCDGSATEKQLSQFMGAVAPAGPERETVLSWLFKIIKSAGNALEGDKMYIYKIYTIVPYQLQVIAQISGEHPQSIERLFYPLTVSTAFNQNIHIPQPVSAQSPLAKTDGGDFIDTQTCHFNDSGTCACNVGYTDVNGKCQKTDSAQLVYNAQAPQQTYIPAGEPTFWRRLFNEQKRFQSKKNKDWFQEKCQYYPALAAKVPALASILGAVAAPFVALSSSCPAPPHSTSNDGSNDTGDNICAIAAAHNIPCCYLKGIQLIESGCDPSTSGTKTCGNFSCCNSGCYCGPMQVGAGLYDALRAGQGIDMCSLAGSAELAARLLIRKQCQGWYNLCRDGQIKDDDDRCMLADKYQCGTNYNWNPDMLKEPLFKITAGDYSAVGYYYGTCDPEPATQSRGWGNMGYCGAVEAYCKTGSITGISCP